MCFTQLSKVWIVNYIIKGKLSDSYEGSCNAFSDRITPEFLFSKISVDATNVCHIKSSGNQRHPRESCLLQMSSQIAIINIQIIVICSLFVK